MIDDHAHPWPLAFEPLDLAAITLDVHPGPVGDARRAAAGPGRLMVELLTSALADLLGVDPDEAVAARDEAAAADWADWVRRLWADADIDGVILDEGVSAPHPGPLDAYIAATGRPVWRLARVDPLVDRLIGEGAAAKDILDAVEAYLLDAVAAGAVGFKTILAYRTGLAVAPDVTLAEAEASLAGAGGGASRERAAGGSDGAGGSVRRRGKALRDLVTRRVFGIAADVDVPVQIHTGFGDSELRLSEANPLLLEEVLRTPEGTAASIVLIHGSHPWPEQVAYLAATRPNVAAELSLSNLFAPLGTAGRLAALLDLAPRDKVLVGSDGHAQPETHWFACRVVRQALADVADRLAAAGARPGWIDATRAAVLAGNAERIYHLG